MYEENQQLSKQFVSNFQYDDKDATSIRQNKLKIEQHIKQQVSPKAQFSYKNVQKESQVTKSVTHITSPSKMMNENPYYFTKKTKGIQQNEVNIVPDWGFFSNQSDPFKIAFENKSLARTSSVD